MSKGIVLTSIWDHLQTLINWFWKVLYNLQVLKSVVNISLSAKFHFFQTFIIELQRFFCSLQLMSKLSICPSQIAYLLLFCSSAPLVVWWEAQNRLMVTTGELVHRWMVFITTTRIMKPGEATLLPIIQILGEHPNSQIFFWVVCTVTFLKIAR